MNPAVVNTVEVWDEGVIYTPVTRVFWLAPESQGGPAIDAASMVTVKLGAAIGDRCQAYSGTITVEALK